MISVISGRGSPGYHPLMVRMVLFLLALATLSAGAEEMLWSLDRYPLDTEEMGRAFRRKNDEQGLVPVGIESDGKTMTVLSLHNSRLGARSWRMSSYDDFELFKKALTDGINEGFTPIDLSYNGNRLFVLFLALEAVPEGWAWVVCPPSAAEIKKVIDPWVEQGYQPTGITMIDGTFGTLLVRFKNRSLRGWTLTADSDVDSLTGQIRQRLARGELPCGLLTGTKATNIVFLSWTDEAGSASTSITPDPDEEEPMTLKQIEAFIFESYVQQTP